MMQYIALKNKRKSFCFFLIGLAGTLQIPLGPMDINQKKVFFRIIMKPIIFLFYQMSTFPFKVVEKRSTFSN